MDIKNTGIQCTHVTKIVIPYLIVATQYSIYCSNDVITLTQIRMHSMVYTHIRRMGKITMIDRIHSHLSISLPLFHPVSLAFFLSAPISISLIQKPRVTCTSTIYRTHKHAYNNDKRSTKSALTHHLVVHIVCWLAIYSRSPLYPQLVWHNSLNNLYQSWQYKLVHLWELFARRWQIKLQ